MMSSYKNFQPMNFTAHPRKISLNDLPDIQFI